jgi:hypothetical protein
MVQVADRDAFLAARELARREGLLVGGSSGAVICAMRQVAQSLPAGARVAVLFPDSASRYLSTIFNETDAGKGMLGSRHATSGSARVRFTNKIRATVRHSMVITIVRPSIHGQRYAEIRQWHLMQVSN